MNKNALDNLILKELKQFAPLIQRADLPRKYWEIRTIFNNLGIASLIRVERKMQPAQMVRLLEAVDCDYASLPFTYLDELLALISYSRKLAISSHIEECIESLPLCNLDSIDMFVDCLAEVQKDYNGETVVCFNYR